VSENPTGKGKGAATGATTRPDNEGSGGNGAIPDEIRYLHTTGNQGNSPLSSLSSAIVGDVIGSKDKFFNQDGKVLIDLAHVPAQDLLDMSTVQSIEKFLFGEHRKGILKEIASDPAIRGNANPSTLQIVTALCRKRENGGLSISSQAVLDVIRTDELHVANVLSQADHQIISGPTAPKEDFSEEDLPRTGTGSSPVIAEAPDPDNPGRTKRYRENGKEHEYLRKRIQEQEEQDSQNVFKLA
jgi:hypothetical protein